jgi:outer membrane protein assembly factor BamB
VSLTPQGQIRWNVGVGRNPSYDGTVQAPAVVNSTVYVPTKTTLVYLRGATGGRIALADTSPNQPTTPAVLNGVAYVGGVGGLTGALQAFDAQTGVLPYYSHTATVAFTSPAVAPDGTVVLGGGNGAGVIWAFAPTNAPQNT